MAKWAVFDVDGTLLPGTSMEKIFVFAMTKQRMIPLKNILAFALSIIGAIIQRKSMEPVQINKRYFKGLNAKQIADKGRQIFHDQIKNKLSQKGIDEVKKYKDMGYNILIMSGSPDFLVLQLQEIYKPDHIVSTTLEVIDGIYTGKVSGLHPFGKRKCEILKNLKTALDIDFEQSMAFANHHSDIFHLNLFKTPVVIDPSNKLKAMALKNGWFIDRW